MRHVIFTFAFLGFACLAHAGETPFHACARTLDEPGKELFLQCTIENPVDQFVLSDVAIAAWKEHQGWKHEKVSMSWDYEVEHVDDIPWAVTSFEDGRLRMARIRQMRNHHAVGYRMYPMDRKIFFKNNEN